MTAARAEALAPEVETGLAVTTTHVYGDCRQATMNMMMTESACPNTQACAKARSGLTLLVAEANRSLPSGSGCGGAFDVAALRPALTGEWPAPESGELVVALVPGTYQLLVTSDGRCADCGVVGAGEPCVVTVERGQVTLRDLVLDRSTR